MIVRNTYEEIYLSNLKNNVSKIINFYNNYKYYFGVVKASSYGLDGLKTIDAVIKGGCNYLAVATLEEALEFIQDDELVEITPFAIRLRKKILDPNERYRINRK